MVPIICKSTFIIFPSSDVISPFVTTNNGEMNNLTDISSTLEQELLQDIYPEVGLQGHTVSHLTSLSVGTWFF